MDLALNNLQKLICNYTKKPDQTKYSLFPCRYWIDYIKNRRRDGLEIYELPWWGWNSLWYDLWNELTQEFKILTFCSIVGEYCYAGQRELLDVGVG